MPTPAVRPPRPVLVHLAVDSAVAFLALVVLGLIIGAPLLGIAGLAVVVGALATPSTRRAETRGLVARARADGLPAPGPAPGPALGPAPGPETEPEPRPPAL